jgi:ABC-type branched-subunit amino acid transport system ATPase component
VLKDGSLICDGSPDSVSQNQEVQEAYLSGGVKHD